MRSSFAFATLVVLCLGGAALMVSVFLRARGRRYPWQFLLSSLAAGSLILIYSEWHRSAPWSDSRGTLLTSGAEKYQADASEILLSLAREGPRAAQYLPDLGWLGRHLPSLRELTIVGDGLRWYDLERL